MPYTKGTATGFDDLISQIVAWVTDASIHGSDAWELMRSDPWPRGTILKAKGIQGEDHCYIGLLPMDIQVNKTYREWLLTNENIGKHIVWSSAALNKPGALYTFDGANLKVYYNKFDPDDDFMLFRAFDTEIFANSCKALVFGVFKQYSAGLDWNEQPGAITFGPLGLKPIKIEGNELQPPLYPGVGYPGIGMNYDEPRKGFFSFWLAKDASRITVVVQNEERWDVGHAGLLIPYHSKMQYPFPAVVAASSSGLTMKEYKNNSWEPPKFDIMFDYSYKNWMQSRAMPPVATVLNDNNWAISQVCLCLPDGSWQFFANWLQNAAKWACKPTRPNMVNYSIKPTRADVGGLVQVFGTEDTYQLEPLELVQDTDRSKNLFGRIWRMHWPSRDIEKYGESTLNGKKCLVLPNCWQGRPWYPYIRVTSYADEDGYTTANQLLQMEQMLFNDSRQTNCIIRLED